MSDYGTLYLIPNALDFGVPGAEVELSQVIPLGAIRIAAGLQYWAAENAKTTRGFLKRVDAIVPLSRPLQAVNIVELPRANKGSKTQAVPDMRPLLQPALDGHDLGLISEAGLPAVADPGALLVAAAHAAGVNVMPLSGPSSLLMALSASGLNGQSFAFVGYLPVEGPARTARIRELETLSRRAHQTQLMIETPYRNASLLTALVEQLDGATRLSVSCGLTMARGWTRTATIKEWKSKPTSVASDVPAVFALLAD